MKHFDFRGLDAFPEPAFEELAREAFSAARARGYGGEDMAAVIKPMAETVGVEVREE